MFCSLSEIVNVNSRILIVTNLGHNQIAMKNVRTKKSITSQLTRMTTRKLTALHEIHTYSHADTEEQAHALMITRECTRLPTRTLSYLKFTRMLTHIMHTLTLMGVLMCS